MFIFNFLEKIKNYFRMKAQFFYDQKDFLDNYVNGHLEKKYEVAGAKILKDAEKSNVRIYLDKLFSAINDKNVHNVALSGGYGTGKSSIVKTFLDTHSYKKKNYVVISIGSFLEYKIVENTTDNDEESSNKIIDVNELYVVDKVEESILKQLIHLNNYDDMPESNLKRVKSRKTKIFILVLIMYLLVNGFFYYILTKFPDFYELLFDLYHKNDLLIKQYTFITSHFSWYFLVLFLSSFTLIYVFAEKIIFNNLVKTIKTEVASVEIKGIEDLTFNRKLFEILYIVKQNRIEAIFFEDIDRFSKDISLMVMEELKELNTIINNSKTIKQDVTFIYEFKDDIFEDYRDRSKFYDYIISVMPLSTSSNSMYLLDGLLKGEKIDLDLIKIVCNHLNDYRTMVNIVNDYKLFKKMLLIDEKENNYLFSTMVYKNIDTINYNELSSGKNYLDNAINTINSNINDRIYELKGYITELENIIKESRCEINNFEDLYSYLIEDIFEMDENGNLVGAQNELSMTSQDLLENLKGKNIDLSQFKCKPNKEKVLLNIQKILNREKGANFYDKKQKYINEYSDLKARPCVIDSKVFKTEVLVDDFTYDMIVSGYLNEKYLDYISLPVVNNIMARNDYQYVFRVTHGHDAAEIILDNPEFIMKYLDPKVYGNMRNYSLFDYLALYQKSIKNDEEINLSIYNFYNLLCMEFKNLTRDKIWFLKNYNGIHHYNGFYSLLERLIINFDFSISLEEFFNKSELNREININDIIVGLLKLESLSLQKHQYLFLTKYINSNNIFINICDLENSVVVDNLKYLKVRFEDVGDEVNLVSSIFKVIYDNNLYSFNSKNIKNMNLKFDEEHKIFMQYVLNDKELFFNECYMLDLKVKFDNKDVIEKMLKSNISLDMKRAILIRENFTTNYVNTDLAIELVENNHLIINWEHIKNFYEKVIFDNKMTIKIYNRLVNLIVDNRDVLFKKKKEITPFIDEKINSKLLTKMLENRLFNETKMYLDKMKTDVKISLSENMDKEAIAFAIINDLVLIDKKNIYNILDNHDISDELKVFFFKEIFKKEKYSINFKYISNNVGVLKEYLKNVEYRIQKEILINLSLSPNLLVDVYSIIFDRRRKYTLDLKDYNRIIRGNENLFNIVKHGRNFIVKRK